MNKMKSYIVETHTASAYNPKRCWVNIGVEKLKSAAEENCDYEFLCQIEGQEYCYRVPARKLQETLEAENVPIIYTKTPRYSFYIEYQSGILYSKLAEGKHGSLLERTTAVSASHSRESGVAADAAEPKHILETLGIQEIEYKELTNKEKELYNYNRLAAVLAKYGMECHWIINDTNGADIVAYRAPRKAEDSHTMTLKIQLKSRFSYNKKYNQEDLYIAFPDGDDWYLIPQESISEDKSLIPEKWRTCESWESGNYHVAQLSKDMKTKLKRYKI